MHPFEDLPVTLGTVGLHWFGQSSFGLKDHQDTTILVDPYFPRDRPNDSFVHANSPLDETSLHTDYVLLTHNHGDHTCIESINRIHAACPNVAYIAPKESASALEDAGIDSAKITVVEGGDTVSIAPLTVYAVWAKPPHGLPEDDIPPPDVTHLGYVVDTGSVRVYFSGDPVNTFAEHPALLDPIRTLKPDIGCLTNHPDEGEFPFFDGSAKIAVQLGLKAVVPAHYSCFLSRDYDPHEWAAHLPVDGPTPLIIPYNQSTVYKPQT